MICKVCNNDALFKCSKCNISMYCSRECQIKDWNLHKNECNIEKIYINSFWPGFIEKTNGVHIDFFTMILTRIFGIKILLGNFNESNILLESHFGSSVISLKKWKYSIFFSGEGSRQINNSNLYTLILGTSIYHNNYIACPLFIPVIYCKSSFNIKNNIKNVPKGLIGAVISNPGTGPGQNSNRNDYINNFINNNVNIDFGGRYKNNIGKIIQGEYNDDYIIKFYEEYKFVLALENSLDDFYITEKITNPFIAGSIPICLGSKNLQRYFNKNRIIDVNDFSKEYLISFINNINEKQWLNMVNQDPMLNTIDHYIEEIINDSQKYLYYKNKKYIISIIGSKTEVERYNKLKYLLEYFHIDFEHITYGNNTLYHKFSNKFKINKKISEISLAINHYELLKKYKNIKKYLCIFESDIIPLKELTYISNKIEDLVDKMIFYNIDFIFIGSGCFLKVPFNSEKICDELYKVNRSKCTDSYIISPNAINKYLEYFENTDNHDAIDEDYNIFFEKEKINVCWLDPELFVQGSQCGVFNSIIQG